MHDYHKLCLYMYVYTLYQDAIIVAIVLCDRYSDVLGTVGIVRVPSRVE